MSARRADFLGGEFDLVFLDPPYDVSEREMSEVLAALEAWIGPDALVVVERSTRAPAPAWPRFLDLEDRRTWGETAVYFAGPAAAAQYSHPTGVAGHEAASPGRGSL